MDHLRQLLAPRRLTSIVDVGANPIDTVPPYTRMLEEGLCRVIGFDPQMSADPHPQVTYLDRVVGSGDPATLHICKMPGMTSLLVPDQEAVSSLPGFAGWSEVVERRTVDTVRLDDIHEIEAMDMLCLDVQGSEMEILRSGPERLASAVAVMTEVSFLTLYQGQATFGEIDNLLRRFGFIPHCFAAAKVWPIETRTVLPRSDPHQLLEADVVYVRDWVREPMSVDQWRHLALLAHHVFGSFDLAMLCIERLVDMDALRSEAPIRYRQMLEAM